MNGIPTQGLFDFGKPAHVPVSHIDTRGWRRVAVAAGRCIGKCSTCKCVHDLQEIARSAVIDTIAFNGTGSPILTPQQLKILQSHKETSTPNESADTLDITVTIPPAPLEICRDDEL